MAKYIVSIYRTSWCDFEVTADDGDSAKELGLQAAANHDWSSEDAEYSVTDIEGGDPSCRVMVDGYRDPETEHKMEMCDER